MHLAPAVNANITLIFENRIQRILPDDAPALSANLADLRQNEIIALSGCIQFKNLLDDAGFLRIDDVLPVPDVIAQRGIAAEELPGLGFRCDAVHGLLAACENMVLSQTNSNQLREIVGRVQDVAEFVLDADDLDAEQCHFPPEAEPVGNVTAASADIIDNDGGELVLPGGGDECLKCRSVGVRAGIGFICEPCRDRDSLCLAMLLDAAHLVFDGAVRLVVGAVAGVCRCGFCLHENSSLIFFRGYAIIELSGFYYRQYLRLIRLGVPAPGRIFYFFVCRRVIFIIRRFLLPRLHWRLCGQALRRRSFPR